jgi:outer membrane protein OmpA-like peptidoglycan-associated protein/Tol biopolymer transport system component
VIALSVIGQAGKLRKADNYYEKLSYSYAAALYEELLGSEVDSPKMKGKLATSYYMMGDTKNAETYYAQMITTGEATREDYFHYAQSLKQNGKYAESDQWMQKFHDNAQADIRGLSFVNNPSYIETIEKQGSRFTINNLSENTPSADFGGYPSVDNKEAFFVSSRRKRIFVQREWAWTGKRFLDLYKADVASGQQLEHAEVITRKVNTRYHEGPMCFAPDGKTVYYTRNNISGGNKKRDEHGIQNLKLYRASVDAEGKWINEEALPFNSQEYSVGHPTVSADGKTLYFASDMPGGFGGADLYKAGINADGTLGTAVNLGKTFNTEGQEMFPWISSDGLLFFSSNGHIGLGGLDVFVVLPAKNGNWGKLMNAGKPVNSQKDDFAFTMNTDGRTGYFSSNREGGKGDDDIYSYELMKPFQLKLMLEGVVTDYHTKVILPGSVVTLEDKDGNVLQTMTADANGTYAFELEEEKDYVIGARKDDYFDRQSMFSTKNLSPDTEVIRKDLNLEKDPGLALYALITDAKTGNPLEGVRMKITDNANGIDFLQTQTPATGDAQKGIADKKVGDKLSYTIKLEKEGYLGKTVTFTHTIAKPGIINVSEKLDLSMDKLDVGLDLATIIDIKPIYFDYGKYAIRKDAAAELDKIVKVMNDYPTMEIELGSHTDCRGSIASNEKLSDNRAKASAAYVKARITNPDRIYGKGYGEAKLKNGCACEGAVKSTCSEAEHHENRRTEFVIIKM